MLSIRQHSLSFLVLVVGPAVLQLHEASGADCDVGDTVVIGIVRTPEGVPVEDARVVGGGNTTVTNSKGEFRLTQLEAGPCSIQVQGKGGAVRNVVAEVLSRSQAKLIEITLFPFQPSCTFEFVDRHGKPIIKQRLLHSYVGSGGRRGSGGLQTDAKGKWKATSIGAGQRRYIFGWPALGFAEQVVNFKDGLEEKGRVVTLKESVTVTGSVREVGTKTPLGGTVLTPIRVRKDGTYDEETPSNGFFMGLHNRLVDGYPITAESRDGDGEYSIQNLPTGKYRILASNGARKTKTDVVIDSTKEIKLDVKLPRETQPGSITGRVLTTGARPLANAEVDILLDTVGRTAPMYGSLNGVPRRTVTDEDGNIRLFPLDVRYKEFWLTASAEGYMGETIKVNVRTGSTVDNIDLVLKRTSDPGQGQGP